MSGLKKILALVSTAAGGYLVFKGLSGGKIPYLEETDKAEAIKKRILDGEAPLDFAPVIYDSQTNRYAAWYRNTPFPTRKQGSTRPKIDGLALRVTYPSQKDEWEDAKEIHVEITNTTGKKSEMAYISVVAASFGIRPSMEKGTGISWLHSQSIQPVLPIPAGGKEPMLLSDTKGNMGDALEDSMGRDFKNIALIVTLYSDWAGTAVYDSVNLLTRENNEMRQAIIDEDLPGEAVWFVRKT